MKTIASSLVLALITLGTDAIDSANAQITPDATLSSPTVRLSAPGNPIVVIGGGTTRGTSLFHSFSQFSISNPGAAIFNNPTTIQTIFARVTGNTPSTINGLLQTQGSASLFLMNPNGIIFGPKALLDVKGSFIATTANQIKFGTQSFDTVIPNNAPLLTVNVPIGLQLSPTSGPITVNSTGHTLTTTDTSGLAPLSATSRPGLQLRPNNTIALLGNTITLNNGVVGAAQGRIEVGSVQDGLVQIEKVGTNWKLGYTGVSNFSDVTLKGRSLLDVGGVNAGSIQVQGRDIKFLDGSNVLSQNIGPIAGGIIQVKASESLEISSTTLDGKIRTGIASETLGLGASSKIIVTAPKITLTKGGGIFTKSFRQGIGGDVEINASDRLDLSGFSPINPILTSGLGTATFGTAKSGNLLVNAKDINLYQGGALNAVTIGTGSSGLLTVNADTIVMGGGITPLKAPSSINVGTFGPGQSGSLTINTRTLDIVRGGAIAATGYTSGNAGSVTVNTSESIFIDAYLERNNKLIAGTINSSILIPEGALQQLINTTAPPTGNAGTVVINTPKLQLQNGGAVSGRNEGTGAGGDIKINTQDLWIINGSRINAIVKDGNAGTITIDATRSINLDSANILGDTSGKGNGGLIKIATPELNLRNRSNISSTSSRSGNAGNIQILNNDRVNLDNNSQITNRSTGAGQGGTIDIASRSLSLNNNSQINASTVLSDGGNLTLHITDFLQLRSGSLLSAEAGGAGNGGNIAINSRFMFGSGNSDIIANAISGMGGTIKIISDGVFGLQYRNTRTAGNDITASSQFGLQGSVTINGLNVDPANGLNTLNTDILDPNQQVSNQCASAQGSQFIATGRGGIPQGPSKRHGVDRPWHDLRPTIAANSIVVQPLAEPALGAIVTSQPLVEASTFERDETGSISLVAAKPIGIQAVATCAMGESH